MGFLTEPYENIFPGNFAPSESAANGAMRAAISGAASKFFALFFCNDRATQPVWCAKADEVLNSTMAFVGNADKANYPVPFRQGEDIASMVSNDLARPGSAAVRQCCCGTMAGRACHTARHGMLASSTARLAMGLMLTPFHVQSCWHCPYCRCMTSCRIDIGV